MAYTPTIWSENDIITAEKLNNIEKGIEENNLFLDLGEVELTSTDQEFFYTFTVPFPGGLSLEPDAASESALNFLKNAGLYIHVKFPPDSADGISFPLLFLKTGVITGVLYEIYPSSEWYPYKFKGKITLDTSLDSSSYGMLQGFLQMEMEQEEETPEEVFSFSKICDFGQISAGDIYLNEDNPSKMYYLGNAYAAGTIKDYAYNSFTESLSNHKVTINSSDLNITNYGVIKLSLSGYTEFDDWTRPSYYLYKSKINEAYGTGANTEFSFYSSKIVSTSTLGSIDETFLLIESIIFKPSSALVKDETEENSAYISGLLIYDTAKIPLSTNSTT